MKKNRGEWAAYVLGCLVVLAQKKGLQLRQGLDFWVKSEVPHRQGRLILGSHRSGDHAGTGAAFRPKFED